MVAGILIMLIIAQRGMIREEKEKHKRYKEISEKYNELKTNLISTKEFKTALEYMAIEEKRHYRELSKLLEQEQKDYITSLKEEVKDLKAYKEKHINFVSNFKPIRTISNR
jgi:rubrerythrin